MFKRSDIESVIGACITLAHENGIHFPNFAYWKVEDWKAHAVETEVMRQVHLGWNVTDFGMGDNLKFGTCSITLRNGLKEHPEVGVPYCEKLGYFRDGGKLALHFHHYKSEDIICKSVSGRFWLELWNTNEDNSLDEKSDVEIYMDGIKIIKKPGERFYLSCGASITLIPRIAHIFGAEEGGGDLLYGEISKINNDKTDNYFYEPLTRFSEIEEDVPMTIPMGWETDNL
jgi:D-lyxose ketol-isomerase